MLKAVGHVQALVFRILIMVMWVAPIGAFGAIAGVVGETGVQAIVSMATLMIAFYLTCVLFIVVVLGGLLKAVTGVNIFRLMKYLGREYLLIFSTSSSEAALPRLIAKMEHVGVSKPVVGVTVPTGYSFNLDGTAIYLTMAALFVASAMGSPLAIGEQISLLVFMIIASKGAAGVTGAGLATLAGGLQSHRPDLVDGVGIIVGIDRFMSEARALTNFTGNAVATLLIGKWITEIDLVQVERVSLRPGPVRRVHHDRRRTATRRGSRRRALPPGRRTRRGQPNEAAGRRRRGPVPRTGSLNLRPQPEGQGSTCRESQVPRNAAAAAVPLEEKERRWASSGRKSPSTKVR